MSKIDEEQLAELVKLRLLRRSEVMALGLSAYVLRKAVTAGSIRPLKLGGKKAKAFYRASEIFRLL